MSRSPSPLVGSSVGDSLGMAFEQSPDDPPRDLTAGWLGEYRDSGPHHNLKAGQWTDDTQLTMALAKSIVNNRFVYDPEKAAKAYLAVVEDGLRAGGKATKAAAANLKAGIPWTESGVDSEGNGSAMRVSPLGLLHRRSTTPIAGDAEIDAMITHNSHEARMGSVAIACAVGWASSHVGRPDTRELVDMVLRRLTGGLLHQNLLELRIRRQSGLSGRCNLQEACKDFAVGGRVTGTVPIAIACFLWTYTFRDAVMAAVRMGGDADTTAAITGAIAGAYYGYEAIPKEWRDGLEDGHLIRTIELQLLDR